MPVVYQGKCSHCAYQSQAMHATDIGIRLDSGEIRDLAHPGETEAIKQLGYTLKKATHEKRFVRIDHLICGRCGTSIAKYTAQPNQSCLLNLVVYVTLNVLGYFFLPFALYINLGLALVGFIIFSIIFRWYQ